MPSTRTFAALVALLVVLAGCNALPGGTGEPSTTAGPAEQTVAFLSSSDHAYNVTVTITDPSGDTVHEHPLSFDGTQARYVPLITLNESGNYTIQVQTDLPAVGGGEMTANATISVDPGSETTVVHTNFHDIEFVTGTARKTDVEVPVKTGWIFQHTGEISYAIHRGTTTVANETVVVAEPSKNHLQQVATVDTTGVYWVAASTNFTHGTTYAVGIVNESTVEILIGTTPGGQSKVRFRFEEEGGSYAKEPPTPAPIRS